MVSDFSKDFPKQYAFAQNIFYTLFHDNLHAVVEAPVKSGKRIMVLSLNQYTNTLALHGGLEESPAHVYLTALNRKDTEPQIKELESFGITCLKVFSKTSAREACLELKKLSRSNKSVVVHFDESDYGTDVKQILSDVWSLGHELGCFFVCYSATNEEAQFSLEFGPRSKYLYFQPHENYCGAAFFLDTGCVQESTPFWEDGEPTEQAVEAMSYFAESGKPISVLRALGSYDELKNSKEFLSFLGKNYKVEPIFIDGSNPFIWEEDYKTLLMKSGMYGVRYLLVINQTCTRSTELKFHEHIAFWHDHRGPSAAYNTCHQAFLRVAHYKKDQCPGHQIKIYAVPEVFQLAAKRISAEEFTKLTGRSLSGRMDQFDTRTKCRHVLKTFEPSDKDEVMGLIRPFAGSKAGIATASNQRKAENLRKWHTYLDGFAKHGYIEAPVGMSAASYAIHIDGPNSNAEEVFLKFAAEFPKFVGKILVIFPQEEERVESVQRTSVKSFFQNRGSKIAKKRQAS